MTGRGNWGRGGTQARVIATVLNGGRSVGCVFEALVYANISLGGAEVEERGPGKPEFQDVVSERSRAGRWEWVNSRL